jgi:hypothetical protein
MVKFVVEADWRLLGNEPLRETKPDAVAVCVSNRKLTGEWSGLMQPNVRTYNCCRFSRTVAEPYE